MQPLSHHRALAGIAAAVLMTLPLAGELRIGLLGGIRSRSRAVHQQLEQTLLYPDTDQPPQLTIRWWTGSSIPVQDVLGINTFGNRKFNLPGVSGQFTMYVASAAFQPIYALCDGIVVCLNPGYDRDQQVIRYGRDYAIEYCHVVNLNPALRVGGIVRKGDKIGEIWPIQGHSALPPGTGYYELRFLRRKSNGQWIMVNLYDYLDPPSQENIREIWLNAAFNPVSTAGYLSADGRFIDYFGNEITTSTICGVVKEIDLPGLFFNHYFIYAEFE